jgi:hypothetical protein
MIMGYLVFRAIVGMTKAWIWFIGAMFWLCFAFGALVIVLPLAFVPSIDRRRLFRALRPPLWIRRPGTTYRR